VKEREDKILKFQSQIWQPRLFIKIWYKDDNIEKSSDMEEMIEKNFDYYYMNQSLPEKEAIE
jgi:hypothetical protein